MHALNINSASQGQLQKLPMIGRKRARAIVEFRRRQGYFRSVGDLDRVPGIGPKIVAGLKNYVTL